MSIDFDWQVSEEGELKSARPPRARFPWRWLLASTVLVALLGGTSWWLLHRPLASQEEVLRTVQLFLDLERRAVTSNDGEMFHSLQTNTARWTRAQRLPFTRAVIAAGQHVVEAELMGGEVWATVAWDDASGETLQRAAFFEWRDGNLLHTPPDQQYRWADYWGEVQTSEHPWGTLQIYAADAEWAEEISRYVDGLVAEFCAELCDGVPLNVIIADSYQIDGSDAASVEIRVPSPRIVALTSSGEPAPIFWQQLREAVEARLASVGQIRFGVPPALLAAFRPLVDHFGRTYPLVQIELIGTPSLPLNGEAGADFFANVDGAYLPPSLEWIEQGWIRQLDDLAALDMSLNITDFQPVALQAAGHEQQLWMLPQSIEVPVIYFDERAELFPEDGKEWETFITRAGYQEQVLGWPREEMWGYADSGETTLLGFAMSHQCAQQAQGCATPVTIETLDAASKTAADTFQQFLQHFGTTPDFSEMSELQRKSEMLTLESPPRRLVAWLDRPSMYEHNGRFAPIGVMPLPGVVNAEGNYARVVPLDVRGGVISAASERPQIVWAWLKFLSEQRPVGAPRQVPARASVAREIDYWTTLPQPLRQIVGASFVDGRAILIAERGLFEE